MINEQKQDSVLRPFHTLMSQFESELTIASNSLNEWNKARTISASSSETPDNNVLTQKISQLEHGKSELKEFLEELAVRLSLRDVEFDSIIESIRSSYRDFMLKLGTARAFLNYKYTPSQKNEINRRITAVNSSSMLNNADMDGLQRQWRSVLTMENDGRLAVFQKMFEKRLSDWESLIERKRHVSSPAVD